MDYKILLLTDQYDQTDTLLASALQLSFSLEKFVVADTIDPDLLLSSDGESPDCILVDSLVLDRFNSSMTTSLSELNHSVPVIILLPFADPDQLIKLLNNRLCHCIIFPVSIKELTSKIEAIITFHTEVVSSRSSFFSHPYFKEFRHELLNHITIAKGYMDVLYTSRSDNNERTYCEKISESIRKIQSVLQKLT